MVKLHKNIDLVADGDTIKVYEGSDWLATIEIYEDGVSLVFHGGEYWSGEEEKVYPNMESVFQKLNEDI